MFIPAILGPARAIGPVPDERRDSAPDDDVGSTRPVSDRPTPRRDGLADEPGVKR
jgi:hypothetical protein